MDDGHEHRTYAQWAMHVADADTRLREAVRTNAGWFPDPAGIHHRRYWDGRQWTAQVIDRNGTSGSHPLRLADPQPEADDGAPVLLPFPSPPCRGVAADPSEPEPESTETRRDADVSSALSARFRDAWAARVASRIAEESSPAEQQPHDSTSTEAAPPNGWYADPGARHQHRHWNGAAWTDRVADDGEQSIDPLRWEPPGATTTAARRPAATDDSGGAHFLARIRSLRRIWVISSAVFLLLTVGYLLLPVSESASSIDGTHTVSLDCGTVLSPQATATRGAELVNDSSICNAARHSNESRVVLFATLATVSLLLAGYSIVSARTSSRS